MLTRLSIQNFVIIESLELELGPGLTIISGETGAGKSIVVDALELALGGRGENLLAKDPERRVEISLEIDVKDAPDADQWLRQRDLADDDGFCALRRLIDPGGRSRAYVNGSPTPLRDVQSLGAHLASVHGQHGHYALLRPDTPRLLLDGFAELGDLSSGVAETASQWRQLRRRAESEDDHARQSREQLLRFQIEELDQIAPTPEGIETMESDQRRLAAAEEIRAARDRALALCDGDEFQTALDDALRALRAAADKDARLAASLELLGAARETLREAGVELRAQETELDQARLAEVEAQLDALYKLAAKHKIKIAELPQRHQALREELADMEKGARSSADLRRELETLAQRYREQAAELGARRATAAAAFTDEIKRLLGELDMKQCDFRVVLQARDDDEPHPRGAEQVAFEIRTNPGQPYGGLQQIASGGELSRLSLALRTAGGREQLPPCLIFDEVDAGVSSGAAEHVGTLLRELGRHSQVLCVTHMATIACCADTHLVAVKTSSETSVDSRLRALRSEKDRVAEIARLLAGSGVTRNSLAHAEEMLRRRGA